MHGPVPWDAQAYDDVAAVQFGWGLRVLARHRWRGDERVLDAGCGPGRLAEAILQRAPLGSVVAVDIDPNMVAAARVRLAHFGPKARILLADLVGLHGVGPFDLVFSNAVLHWIEDQEAAFRTFHDLLRPGGELLLQCGGEGNLAAVREAARKVLAQEPFARRAEGWEVPWWYSGVAETRERLARAGFPDAVVTLDPEPTAFHDRDAYVRFAKAVVLNPYLRRLPTQDLRDAFVEAYLREAEPADGHWTLDYVRLNVLARRPGKS